MTNRIRLLVSHDRNRELLAEWLSGAYEVSEGPLESGDRRALSESRDGDPAGDAGLTGKGDPAGDADRERAEREGAGSDPSGPATETDGSGTVVTGGGVGDRDGPGAGDEPLADTDLCLVDEAGFDRYRDRVIEWKNRADPVFAPVLLVAEGGPEGLDPDDWETLDGLYVVDDLVTMPVRQAVFQRRLENLLSRRDLSTDLARSYRRSEERFSSLFHATPDPALVLADGHITYVNDAFCEAYGVDREDTHWRHLDELPCLPADTVASIEGQIRRAVHADGDSDGEGDGAHAGDASDGDDWAASSIWETDRIPEAGPDATEWEGDTETVVVESADGETRYVETNVKPMTVDDRPSVALVMRDVTERRERKRELERQNDRLEQFASIVSHDLRNPLQVLDGRLSQLEYEYERDGDGSGAGENGSGSDDGAESGDDGNGGGDDGTAGGVALDEHLPPLRRSVDRMYALVDDLLTLARQGETVTDPEPATVATVAGEAWTTTDAPEADLALRTGQSVAADESRLRQLFENLFRNAVEHGGEDVSVVVDDLPDCDGFFVADDGSGIPPEDRETVLEMGYTDSEDGTGLGLGIVSEVATAHEWSVTVTESESGGARFEFRGVE